jgi:hypothetical protein
MPSRKTPTNQPNIVRSQRHTTTPEPQSETPQSASPSVTQPPSLFGAHNALHLQRTLGNRATERIVSRTSRQPAVQRVFEQAGASQVQQSKGNVGTTAKVVQRERNKKRWTPQQREQSRKFWEHKEARMERKEQAIRNYAASAGIDIDQARVLSNNGYLPKIVKQVLENNKSLVTDPISLFFLSFSSWAINNISPKTWSMNDLIDLQLGTVTDNLVNGVLKLGGLKPWVESEHEEEKAKGAKRLEGKPENISDKLGVDTSKRASANAFELSEDYYTAACTFASVKQALRSPADLTADILELVKMRVAKCKSEHAIQSGNDIFFKGEPNDSTVVHELTHFYGAQDKFIQDFCFGKADGINEGFTEYFARKVKKADNTRKRTVYTKEIAAVEFIATKIDMEVLKNAYFGGNVNALKEAYEQKIGKTWTADEEQRIIAFGLLS